MMAETKNYHGLAKNKSGQPIVKNVPPGDVQVQQRSKRGVDSRAKAKDKGNGRTESEKASS